MSQPPHSSAVPSGYPPGHPTPPTRHRPSWAWFLVGAGLIVTGVAAGIAIVVWLLTGLASTEAGIPADGTSHVVSVDTDGDRLIWHDGGAFRVIGCSVIDRQTGADIPLEIVTGEFTRAFGSDEWHAIYRFAPGSGDLEIVCRPRRASSGPVDIEITPAPSVGVFVGGVVAAIAIPGLLGLFGLATLIVTGVLWATRPARPKP